MKKTLLISIVTPVYKKEEIIETALNQQIKFLEAAKKKHGIDYEIITVIDGKLDNSEDKIRELKNSNIRIISYKENKGKGYALRRGMKAAKGDFIGFMDACTDMSAEVLQHLITQILAQNEAEIVVGSKRHTNSKVNYTLKRKLFTKGYSLFVKLLTGIDYKDTQVGAKMFSAELVHKVLPRILAKRYAIDIELLAVAHRLGYKKHIDVPVTIDFDADVSTISLFFTKNSVRHMILETLAVFYRLRILKHYDDDKKEIWKRYDLDA